MITNENDTLNDIKSFPAEELLTSVMDEMLEGFQVISHDWHYLYLNNMVAEQARKRREELVGKTVFECFPGIYQTSLFVQMEKCIKEKMRIKMETEFEYPDKSTAWFQLYISPTKEGIVILSVDIADRKRMEARLQAKINEFNKLLELVADQEDKLRDLRDKVKALGQYHPGSLHNNRRSEWWCGVAMKMKSACPQHPGVL